MSENLNVWTEYKEHSVEGHEYTGTLKFKGKNIWGPRGCHGNTMQLGTAINNADWRFFMNFETKKHSVEGHTRYISVKDKDEVTLKLGTHDSMDELAAAIRAALAADGNES